jgi:threonine synthase
LPKELADCASETILSTTSSTNFAELRAYLLN